MPITSEIDHPQDAELKKDHPWTPQEAADVIHDDLDDNPLTPQDRHAEKFVNDVVAALGWELTPSNWARVSKALHDHDIDPVHVDEYPKHVIVQVPDHERRAKGEAEATKDYALTVRNADEEARANDGNLDADEIARIEGGRPVRKDRARVEVYGGTVARDPAGAHGPLADAQQQVATARPDPVGGDGPDFGNAHHEPQRSEPTGPIPQPRHTADVASRIGAGYPYPNDPPEQRTHEALASAPKPPVPRRRS